MFRLLKIQFTIARIAEIPWYTIPTREYGTALTARHLKECESGAHSGFQQGPLSLFPESEGIALPVADAKVELTALA